ncbi:MAG: GntR family transcriptional regulator [Nocardioides sp.]|uniref:GntR family transcriptional regulator n=1 Tax=Nocardioides sp. TaxID=35761 RepID=UPI0039E64917
MTDAEGSRLPGGESGTDVLDLLLARSLGAESDREPLVGRIARDIARDVIEGRIPPGAELTSIDLAERFETSRTPPREALLVLEREGLIEIRARRRPRVALLPRERVTEVYELRALLYAEVARRLARSAGEADLDELQHPLDEMIAAAREGDRTRAFWSNVLFHEVASSRCGDQTLKQTADALDLRVLPLRHFAMTRDAGELERWWADHVRLVLALRDRDGELAAVLNRSIVTSGLPGLLLAYDDFALTARPAASQ